MVSIKKEILKELIRISKDNKPNEVAAYLFKDNTVVKRIITEDESPAHFSETNTEIVLEWINDYGKPTAIFHSHPGGAQPSMTDVTYMSITIPFYGCPWLIMSGNYKLRAWDIWVRDCDSCTIKELEVEIIE